MTSDLSLRLISAGTVHMSPWLHTFTSQPCWMFRLMHCSYRTQRCVFVYFLFIYLSGKVCCSFRSSLDFFFWGSRSVNDFRHLGLLRREWNADIQPTVWRNPTKWCASEHVYCQDATKSSISAMNSRTPSDQGGLVRWASLQPAPPDKC